MGDTGGKSGRRPGRHLQVEASGLGNATSVQQRLAGRSRRGEVVEGCAGGAEGRSKRLICLRGTWMGDTGGKSGRRPGRHLQVQASGRCAARPQHPTVRRAGRPNSGATQKAHAWQAALPGPEASTWRWRPGRRPDLPPVSPIQVPRRQMSLFDRPSAPPAHPCASNFPPNRPTSLCGISRGQKLRLGGPESDDPCAHRAGWGPQQLRCPQQAPWRCACSPSCPTPSSRRRPTDRRTLPALPVRRLAPL